MFDSKMLLVILAIALVLFGTKRLRTMGSDLGAAVKGFKQATAESETGYDPRQISQRADSEKPNPSGGEAKAKFASGD